MKQVIVIGGGAAGMMAAIGAAKEGARVTLLEQNEKTGKFEPYVSRWYRLPGEYTDPTDAMNVILEFQKKYLL